MFQHMSLELGQRIHDDDYQRHGTIVARRVGENIQYLDGFADNEDLVVMAECFLTDEDERMFFIDNEEGFHYTFTFDNAITEVFE